MSHVMSGPRAAPLHTMTRFVGIGALCGLLTLAIIFVAKTVFGAGDVLANACGYGVGVACSFVLNRRWTFDDRSDTFPALLRFLGVCAAAYALNLVAVLSWIRLGGNDYTAHLAGLPVYTAVSYLGSRWFAFPARGDAPGHDVAPHAQTTAFFWAWLLATCAVALGIVFYRLGSRPIVLWDESRLANSALEMARSGLSLVTTFDGVADHWNTKPPLAIWLMSVSIRVFGPNEWAVRLPSAMAAVATAVLMFVFCARRLASPVLGFASAMLLLSTTGYVLFHGARSGDYDAVLTLCTTAYLMSAYLVLHGRAEDRTRWLLLCAAGIVCAFMVKSIQGLIFLPAVLLYVVLSGQLVQTIRLPAVRACAVMVVLAMAGYYLVREQIDPGYFEGALTYDLLGRFNTVIENHHGGVWWYVLQVGNSPWLLPGLASAAWLAWRGDDEHRRLAAYLGLTSVFYLIVISLAKTKLPWYPMPLYPLLAVLTVLGCDALIMRAAREKQWQQWWVSRRVAWASLGIGLVALANNAAVAELGSREERIDELDAASLFLRGPAVEASRFMHVAVIHPGYPEDRGIYYAAPTLFYAHALTRDGREVVVQAPQVALADATDAVVLCGSMQARRSAVVLLPAVVEANGCGLYPVATKR